MFCFYPSYSGSRDGSLVPLSSDLRFLLFIRERFQEVSGICSFPGSEWHLFLPLPACLCLLSDPLWSPALTPMLFISTCWRPFWVQTPPVGRLFTYSKHILVHIWPLRIYWNVIFFLFVSMWSPFFPMHYQEWDSSCVSSDFRGPCHFEFPWPLFSDGFKKSYDFVNCCTFFLMGSVVAIYPCSFLNFKWSKTQKFLN